MCACEKKIVIYPFFNVKLCKCLEIVFDLGEVVDADIPGIQLLVFLEYGVQGPCKVYLN